MTPSDLKEDVKPSFESQLFKVFLSSFDKKKLSAHF